MPTAKLTGLALREAVARKVMDHGAPTFYDLAGEEFTAELQRELPPWETEEGLAHQVIERMVGLGCAPLIRFIPRGRLWRIVFVVPHDDSWYYNVRLPSGGSTSDSFSEAVCQAAIIAADLLNHV